MLLLSMSIMKRSENSMILIGSDQMEDYVIAAVILFIIWWTAGSELFQKVVINI